MSESFFPRDLVAERLAVSTATLIRYERIGLVQARRVAPDQPEGYGPVEVRRLWSILTFQRDLGINLAGVEVILRLRDQIDATHAHLDRLARDLRAMADRDSAGGEIDGELA